MKKWCNNCKNYNNSWREIEANSSETQCLNYGEFALIPSDKEDGNFLSYLHYLFSLPFLHRYIEAKDWLERNYPLSERKNITDLSS